MWSYKGSVFSSEVKNPNYSTSNLIPRKILYFSLHCILKWNWRPHFIKENENENENRLFYSMRIELNWTLYYINFSIFNTLCEPSNNKQWLYIILCFINKYISPTNNMPFVLLPMNQLLTTPWTVNKSFVDSIR